MLDQIPREHPQRWNMIAVRFWLQWHRGIDGLELNSENWTDEERAAARYVLTTAEVAGLSDPDGVVAMNADPPVPDLTLASAALYLLATELGRASDWANIAVELAAPTRSGTVTALEYAKAQAETVGLATALLLLLTTPVDDVDVSINSRVSALDTPCTLHTIAACYALSQLHQQRPSRLTELREMFSEQR